MSRQRAAILRALNDAGVPIREIEWEPIGRGAEKEGPSGGWTVVGLDYEHIGCAYDHQSLVRAIQDSTRRPDSEAGRTNGRLYVYGFDLDEDGHFTNGCGSFMRPVTESSDG